MFKQYFELKKIKELKKKEILTILFITAIIFGIFLLTVVGVVSRKTATNSKAASPNPFTWNSLQYSNNIIYLSGKYCNYSSPIQNLQIRISSNTSAVTNSPQTISIYNLYKNQCRGFKVNIKLNINWCSTGADIILNREYKTSTIFIPLGTTTVPKTQLCNLAPTMKYPGSINTPAPTSANSQLRDVGQSCTSDFVCKPGLGCAIDEITNTGTCQTIQTLNYPSLTPGSYAIFDNRDANGKFLGLTRLEIELSGCGSYGDKSMRFTKNEKGAYWSSIDNLRFCVKSQKIGLTEGLFAGGYYSYDPKWDIVDQNPKQGSLAHVEYSGNQSYGIMGKLGLQDSDMAYRWENSQPMYALYPRQALVNPQSKWTRWVYKATGWVGNLHDIWHIELSKPTHGGNLLARYVESYTHPVAWQSLIEDWEFDNNLLTFIGQRENCPKGFQECSCYDDPASNNSYTCDQKPFIRNLNRINYYYPSRGDKFSVSFENGSTAKTIRWGEPYEVKVKTPDNQPYSGFLRIQTQSKDTNGAVWTTQKENFPIFMSGGYIKILPSAYGSVGQTGTTIKFKLKQQVANVALTVDKPVAASYNGLLAIPNRTDQQWSNELTLTILRQSSPTAR